MGKITVCKVFVLFLRSLFTFRSVLDRSRRVQGAMPHSIVHGGVWPMYMLYRLHGLMRRFLCYILCLWCVGCGGVLCWCKVFVGLPMKFHDVLVHHGTTIPPPPPV